MGTPASLRTERLLLRPWTTEDRDDFAALNDDAEVMRFFPARLSREESDALVHRIESELAEQGWGLWAVEVVDEADFIGFIGLKFWDDLLAEPCIEVGWRLARPHWGQGFAPEGAIECLNYGFGILDLEEIVSCTSVVNDKSRRVMEKIGMHRDPGDDFDHPRVEGPLRPHVLFRAQQSSWTPPI